MSTTPESAVQRCLDAFNQADAREDARNDFSPEALARVHRAWRRAMPILTPDTIDAFIACVTHGLLYEVFPLAEASKLLYAAQVTLGLLRDRNKSTHSKSPQPKSELAAPQAPPTPLPFKQGDASVPQPSRAPSMATASSSPWVGDHEPQPTEPAAPTPTPLPPPSMAPKAQLAAPQVPPTPSRKQAIKDREQVEAFLAQAFATPPPSPLTLAPGTLTPTPSPLRNANHPQAGAR